MYPDSDIQKEYEERFKKDFPLNVCTRFVKLVHESQKHVNTLSVQYDNAQQEIQIMENIPIENWTDQDLNFYSYWQSFNACIDECKMLLEELDNNISEGLNLIDTIDDKYDEGVEDAPVDYGKYGTYRTYLHNVLYDVEKDYYDKQNKWDDLAEKQENMFDIVYK